uniref:Uncharacterized protein n=1 Tax=Anguilla anguilla TaxID=7936 RepID=A0A0E9XB76_ANGAN
MKTAGSETDDLNLVQINQRKKIPFLYRLVYSKLQKLGLIVRFVSYY